MEIFIRNMVCRHCVSTVERAFREAGLAVNSVILGKADVDCPPDVSAEDFLKKVDTILIENDFERIADPDLCLVEEIKRAVIAHVRSRGECRLNLSACISEKLPVSYDNASRVFSRIEGRTIERYHIAQKIEFVKELLAEPALSLAEIADIAGYSSVAHLSRRFKEETGMTPGKYQSSGLLLRKSIDKI